MRVSHTLDRLHVGFDDQRLVAEAGLLLPATLSQHLGLSDLIDEVVNLGEVPGAAHPGEKAMTVISSVLAGGDCIDDVDALRAGGCGAVVGHRVAAPSTVGTFLRAFRWGHVRQLDAAGREILARAWKAGAGPGADPLTIDVDSTICETYGLLKQGGARFTYTHVRGYHPLLAVAAGTGDVLHARLRGGSANSVRGAASFVGETVSRVRAAGATGDLVLRTDSGFFSSMVVRTCRRHGVRFSITVRLRKELHRVIAEIPEDAWVPIPYFHDAAEVAETTYTPFRRHDAKPVRLIVRRIRPTPGSQLALEGILFTHHAFITDRDGDTLELEADHRRHAEVENTIRDLKEGVALNHLPSGRFAANAAWLALNVIAHNLARWVSRLGLGEALVRTKTLRFRHFSLPGRLARSARRLHLHLPAAWPWAQLFLAALDRLRALQPLTPA
ncbi:MAG: IS1380 family transposase [Thermoplasmata archaeon]